MVTQNKYLDLVVGGPDMSGTSTQIEDIINYFQTRGKVVRDIRGTESDALFHTEDFQKWLVGSELCGAINLSQFFNDASPEWVVRFLKYSDGLLRGGGTNQDLRIASMVRNDVSTYIDPQTADVWIMEEPTKRGAGQVCRAVEQNRSGYGSQINGKAAAEAHSIYRTDEFLRFRETLRNSGKIIVRSRSEESACYQMMDEKVLPSGVDRDYYFGLEGHKTAFANPPSHIFVVCGPENWTEGDYLELKAQRSGGRMQDDHEKNAAYQVLVNFRYASDWLENLYEQGCKFSGSRPPEIKRFSIYGSKDSIREQMYSELDKLSS